MSRKKIELAPQEHIGVYEDTARAFFRELLDLSYDAWSPTKRT